MATATSPVELPVGRHSFLEFPMAASISDPTSWDAFSNDGELTRRNSRQTIASDYTTRAFPIPPSRAPSRGQQSIRSVASPAAEFPPQELEAQPLSYFPPRGSSTQNIRQEQSRRQAATQDAGSETGHLTHSSDDYTGSTRSASTTGTHDLRENQVYSLSPTSPQKEETADSPVLQSARSRSNSTKKSTVPTSKYKKKPPASLKSSIKPRSVVEQPLGSPMSGYTQILQSPTSTQSTPALPCELPAAAVTLANYPPPPPEPPARLGQAPLQHAKSTASVRKARALHSHPSLPTIKTQIPPSPAISQPSPVPSTQRNRKSMDTIRNRPSLYDLQEPSPAPTTPLPELPVGARPLSRPASRDVNSAPMMPPPDAHVRPGTSSSNVAPTLRRQDTNPQAHAEMANFMTSNNKVVFRRFHDVHVRLLLTLQDEISALEKELAEIENASPTDVNREGRRVRVLGELRKLMAEYDHLFSNWNLMQSSKADANTREELENFLQRHTVNPSSLEALSAREDLLWLQHHSNDLSCVDLNAKKSMVAVSQTEILSEKQEPPPPPSPPVLNPATTRSPGGGGGGGGGFAALFASCAGRRK